VAIRPHTASSFRIDINLRVVERKIGRKRARETGSGKKPGVAVNYPS
jgi:hypothetical protein